MRNIVELIHAVLDQDILDSINVAAPEADHLLAMQIQTLRSLKRIEDRITSFSH